MLTTFYKCRHESYYRIAVVSHSINLVSGHVSVISIQNNSCAILSFELQNEDQEKCCIDYEEASSQEHVRAKEIQSQVLLYHPLKQITD